MPSKIAAFLFSVGKAIHRAVGADQGGKPAGFSLGGLEGVDRLAGLRQAGRHGRSGPSFFCAFPAPSTLTSLASGEVNQSDRTLLWR